MNRRRHRRTPSPGPPGPELVLVIALGDTIHELKTDALDQARTLYGEDARLEIEAVTSIRSAGLRRPHRLFTADIRVRNLDGVVL